MGNFRVMILDVETGSPRHEFPVAGPVGDAWSTADGQRIVLRVMEAARRRPFTVHGGFALHVHALDGTLQRRVPTGPELEPGFRLATMPDGLVAVFGSRALPRCLIQLREEDTWVERGELVVTGLPLDPHGAQAVLCATFPSDGERFFVGTTSGAFVARASDGRVIGALDMPIDAWAAQSAMEGLQRGMPRGRTGPRLVVPPLRHARSVLRLALAPDESWLAGIGIDGLLRVWALPSLDHVASHATFELQARSLDVSPDGGFIALGGGFASTAVQIWRCLRAREFEAKHPGQA